MRKTITFFGLSLMLLIFSKLDAFFAVAIASEKYGIPSQSAYKYFYDAENPSLDLETAQSYIQRLLIEIGIKENQSWNVSALKASKNTGDFSMPHGFFAIIKAVAVNSSDPKDFLCVIGAGVSNDPTIALNNALKDMNDSLENINSNVIIGVFEAVFTKSLEEGIF